MRSFILAFSAVLTLGCAVVSSLGCSRTNAPALKEPDAAPAIVGGRAAALNSNYFRHVVRLTMIGTYRMGACSGTFITTNIVLTAAHCVTLVPYNRIEVEFRTDDDTVIFKTRGTDVVFKSAYKTSDSSDDDFALVKTEDPTPFPVTKLAHAVYPKGAVVAAAGFGIHHLPYRPFDGDGSSYTANLKFVLLKLLTDSAQAVPQVLCSEKMCVSSGDSGGPLFAWNGSDIEQIGVASTVSEDFTAQYAGVLRGLDWIRQAILVLQAPASPAGFAPIPASVSFGPTPARL